MRKQHRKEEKRQQRRMEKEPQGGVQDDEAQLKAHGFDPQDLRSKRLG